MNTLERVTITVDYSKTLVQMIDEMASVVGGILVSPDIEALPFRGEGVVQREISLFKGKHGESDSAVERKMDFFGLRPGGIEDLLALGIARPILTSGVLFLALGSAKDSKDAHGLPLRVKPCLSRSVYWDVPCRQLSFVFGCSNERCRYLAIPKSA